MTLPRLVGMAPADERHRSAAACLDKPRPPLIVPGSLPAMLRISPSLPEGDNARPWLVEDAVGNSAGATARAEPWEGRSPWDGAVKSIRDRRVRDRYDRPVRRPLGPL